MVYHFRYNVGYQTYLVLLTKYLLYHAKSFSAFSVTFANRLEKPLNLITEFINLITNCAYEKSYLLCWQHIAIVDDIAKTIMTNITFIGIMGAILSSDKYSHKYKFSVKHKFYSNVGR